MAYASRNLLSRLIPFRPIQSHVRHASFNIVPLCCLNSKSRFNYESNTITAQRTSIRSMAGHSKWQNIRHIKAAKDGQKQRVTSQIVQKIKIAIQEGGSPDPKLNSRLANIMQQAKDANIPNATLDNAIKSMREAQKGGQLVYIEAMGPGNFMMIIECFTDKPKWCRDLIQGILKKTGGRSGPGLASHSFDMKGMVQTAVGDAAVDLDAATDAAIEAGAEDVTETTGDNEEKVLQFLCDFKDLHVVKTNLQDMNYSVTVSRMLYVPTMHVPVSKENLVVAENLLNRLEDNELVLRIYDNIEPPS